ncbi:MAG: hypothetical protein AAFY15_03785, partial [Cyanobacteria bacterium J06648_11]
MMSEQLSEAQLALIPEFRKKWERIALCTERIDPQKASDAVNTAYAVNGFAEPEICICTSP